MTAKIIIDRKVKKGSVSEFLKLLEELRGKAVSAKGYISGETLQASDDPHNLIVVSTWHSVEEWKNWVAFDLFMVHNEPKKEWVTNHFAKGG